MERINLVLNTPNAGWTALFFRGNPPAPSPEGAFSRVPGIGHLAPVPAAIGYGSPVARSYRWFSQPAPEPVTRP